MDSIWSKTCKSKVRPALHDHIQADVAVIGGGMAGILTAWQLQKAGVRVVVLEAGQIGSGQTKNTTAKITSQHGMFCHSFMEKKGIEKASKYVQANQLAVEAYKRIVREETIDCDLKDSNAYVYSVEEEKLVKEAEAAKKLGVDAFIEHKPEIPLSVSGAVYFPNQAEFHPLKFMQRLAEELIIYENSMVIGLDKHEVKTEHGSVSADNIVFATHYPYINFPGMHFARLHQERSYVLALENAGQIQGMYIGDGEKTLSFRQYKQYLLLGGQEHRTGENVKGDCYHKLKEVAAELYPQSRVAAFWSAQDCMTTDGIPLIGRYAASRPSWYVATGFGKWGMSLSMVSAMILSDMICRKENPYADVFSPSRFSLEEISPLMKQSGEAVKSLAKRFFHIPKETIEGIQPGHGAVVSTPHGKVGVYKTEENEIHQVDIVCPHLGCELTWNSDEKSWDCPCHGSRFDYEGKLLDGPAQKEITDKY